MAAANVTVTLTDAATVYIENSPANGANVTITNPWSLWVDNGGVRLDGSLKTAGQLTGTVVPEKYIQGLTWNSSVADTVNDIQIVAGEATSEGDTSLTRVSMILASALTKQLDVTWAVGNNAGGLDTGAIGNSDYYIWLIQRIDTGVVDCLFSLSSTAPTMPTNYTKKRLIGWFKRTAGAISTAYTVYELSGGGIEYVWTTATVDVALTDTLTTTRRTDALRVPLNFSVVVRCVIHLFDATSVFQAYVGSPDMVDQAATTVTGTNVWTVNNVNNYTERNIRTSSAGLIAARSNLATVDTYEVSTHGFVWARR